MKDCVVNGYSKRWLKRRFPWVYPNEILGSHPRVGEEVELRSEDGELLGRGIGDEGRLAVRVYRHDGGPLDAQWMRDTLTDALALRQELLPEGTNGYRLVHGENDGLPGIRVDWWSHYAVVSMESPALATLLPRLIEGLAEATDPRGIYVCKRFGDRQVKPGDKLTIPVGLALGKAAPGLVRVQERGLVMDVDVADGPDVGLYTDMRDLRAWLEVHWGAKRVLNTFAYTGAFSVASAMGGASEVVTVDLSASAIERAESNFRANGLSPEDHTFVVADVWKVMDRLRRKGERFDRVILDPPSYARGGTGGFQTQKDYPRLIAAACRVLHHGGWLVVASNHGAISPHQFRGLCLEGMHKAKCQGQLLYVGSQSGDVPAATWFPEGSYLKTAVYRVLDPARRATL